MRDNGKSYLIFMNMILNYLVAMLVLFYNYDRNYFNNTKINV